MSSTALGLTNRTATLLWDAHFKQNFPRTQLSSRAQSREIYFTLNLNNNYSQNV